MANQPSILNIPGYQELVGNDAAQISSAISAHEAKSNPHTQYQLTSQKNTANGYAGLSTAADLMVPKASGTGIRVDSTGTPTFGWADLLGAIHPTTSAAASPMNSAYIGNIRQYNFAVGDEVTNEFHIPHDYVKGTDIYCHIHWSHNSSIVTSGGVAFGLEMSYAKFHNQASFNTPVTQTLSATASTAQYRGMLNEAIITGTAATTSLMDRALLEPDGVLLVRTTLSANTITVSSGAAPQPFIHYIDIHYQSNGVPTKQKSPDFYT